MDTILYRTFVVCLLTCATCVISLAWLQPDEPPWFVPSIVVTTFVIGLASFLLWFTRLFRDLDTQVTKKEY